MNMNMMPLLFAMRKKKYKNLSSSERMKTAFPFMFLPQQQAMLGAVTVAEQLKNKDKSQKELSDNKSSLDFHAADLEISLNAGLVKDMVDNINLSLPKYQNAKYKTISSVNINIAENGKLSAGRDLDPGDFIELEMVHNNFSRKLKIIVPNP